MDLANEEAARAYLADLTLGGSRLAAPVFYGPATFQWKMNLAKRKERVILWFTRQKTKNLVQADVTMEVGPYPPEFRSPADMDFLQTLMVPNFMVPFPDDERESYLLGQTGLNKSDLDHVALFGLGPDNKDILAMHVPNDDDTPLRIWFHPENGAIRELMPSEGFWPIRPILQLLEEIAAWVSGHETASHPVALRVSHADSETRVDDADTDTARFLGQLGTTWRSARKAFLKLPENPLIRALTPGLDIHDFQTHVRLRLDKNGNITSSDKPDDQAFMLRLRGRIHQDGVRPRFQVFLTIPDFLVKMNLRYSLLEPFGSGQNLKALQKEMKDAAGLRSFTGAGDFLEDAAATSVIFRARRKVLENEKENECVFILRAPLHGRQYLLIFRAFLKKKNEQAPADQARYVVKKKSKSKVLFFGPIDQEHATGLDDDVMDYLKRMIRAWRQCLKTVH